MAFVLFYPIATITGTSFATAFLMFTNVFQRQKDTYYYKKKNYNCCNIHITYCTKLQLDYLALIIM